MPNLIAKDGGKNKRWDIGVVFDEGWKKLPIEKTLNACVISTHFQTLVP
jgi:hypothetical protein